AELAASNDPVVKKLDAATAKNDPIAKLPLDEKTFRYLVNDDQMATEKTSDGIRKFSADIVKLEKLIASKL
ncbi:MAG: transaldolase family protein, partial [Chthoniobacteraceae bacterium]